MTPSQIARECAEKIANNWIYGGEPSISEQYAECNSPDKIRWRALVEQSEADILAALTAATEQQKRDGEDMPKCYERIVSWMDGRLSGEHDNATTLAMLRRKLADLPRKLANENAAMSKEPRK